MGEKQAGQLLRFEGSDLSTIRRSARLRVSPKAWATVDNRRLIVDADCDGDSALPWSCRRRPTAENDDLGHVGCRIVLPIRLAERRPFGAAGSRFVLDYLLRNCRIEQKRNRCQHKHRARMSLHQFASFNERPARGVGSPFSLSECGPGLVAVGIQWAKSPAGCLPTIST